MASRRKALVAFTSRFLSIEVSTFEQVLDRYESWHPSIIAESGRVCTRAIKPTDYQL
jgi:hypothetical protein